jgi:aryl-alcohol dehydrogenase-like predicted oxidoreductase
MQTRELGNSGLRVGRPAFGGNVFGWTADEPTSFELVDAFVGARQGGESEAVVGNWPGRGGKRGQAVIATRAWLRANSRRWSPRAPGASATPPSERSTGRRTKRTGEPTVLAEVRATDHPQTIA